MKEQAMRCLDKLEKETKDCISEYINYLEKQNEFLMKQDNELQTLKQNMKNSEE